MFNGLRNKLLNFSSQFKKKIAEKTENPPEENKPPVFEPKKEIAPREEERLPASEPAEPKKTDAPKPETPEEPRLKAQVGIAKKAKAIFTGSIEIAESDLKGLLSELELSLLEADVEQETALEIVSKIQKTLVGQKIRRGTDTDSFLNEKIREALLEILDIPGIDLLEKSKAKKPLVILLLGPNGAGKTTTLAKLTYFFQKHHKHCVWAAGDTFRAASIEQLEKHAQAFGVRVIKHQYGADPGAVAFDAISAANAHQLDVVLIDSAGRQETNKNLVEELKKLVRVSKPDLKIFVGESYSGQALLQQAKEFDLALGIDAFILTKMDTDPKGGTLLSLLFQLKKPVLFLGSGQGYEDLEVFEPKKIVSRII